MAALTRRIRWRRLGVVAALGVAALAPVARGDDAARPPQQPRELVVVAHGLGRTPLSMLPIRRALEAQGYEVMSFGYSSYCCGIPEIGESLRRDLAERMGPQHTKVHFVGHSLGNIVIRYVLTRDTLPPRVGRVVMLAPPNQGAHAANTFTPWAGWLLRPMPELQADTAATVRKLPRVEGVEIGVIAGRDDRTVKLPETHLPEETAHLIVPGGHSFIMRRDDVKRQVVSFIRSGRFETGAAATEGGTDPR